MQPRDFENMREDQERGIWRVVCHPVTGAKSDLELLVVGPDSATAARATAAMVDELAELADLDGRVSGEKRARAKARYLARHVKDWRGAGDASYSFDACTRLIEVSRYVEACVDTWAGDRRGFWERAR